MSEQNEKRILLRWPLLALALLGVAASGFYIHKNYDVRLVRIDAVATTADLASADAAAVSVAAKTSRPTPIIVRLACVDAGAAVRGLKAPNRSLRQQLRQGDPRAPAPVAGKRCKPDAATLATYTADAADGMNAGAAAVVR